MLIFSFCWCPFSSSYFLKGLGCNPWDASTSTPIFKAIQQVDRLQSPSCVGFRLVFLFLLVLSLIEIGQLLKVQWKTDRQKIQSQKTLGNSKENGKPHIMNQLRHLMCFKMCFFFSRNAMENIFKSSASSAPDILKWRLESPAKSFWESVGSVSWIDVKDVAKWYTYIIYHILYNHNINVSCALSWFGSKTISGPTPNEMNDPRSHNSSEAPVRLPVSSRPERVEQIDSFLCQELRMWREQLVASFPCEQKEWSIDQKWVVQKWAHHHANQHVVLCWPTNSNVKIAVFFCSPPWLLMGQIMSNQMPRTNFPRSTTSQVL